MTVEVIRLLVGQAPVGLESIEYVASLILSLFVVKIILEMFYFVFNLIGKR